MDATLDVLDDPNARHAPFFAKATSCLVNTNPAVLLRVRNQGRSNTCYAFPVTATIYGDEVKRGRSAIERSTQELFDYLHRYERPKTVNARGSFKVPRLGFTYSYKVGFNYVRDHGISTAEEYKWVGSSRFKNWRGGPWDGKVLNDEKKEIQPYDKTFINGYYHIRRKDIKKVLQKQPITGHVPLTHEFLTWRGEGIYTGGKEVNKDLRHGVTVVGYGCEEGVPYYICQNSYGTEWGYRGYFKVREDLVSLKLVPHFDITTEIFLKLDDDVDMGYGVKGDDDEEEDDGDEEEEEDGMNCGKEHSHGRKRKRD